MTTPKAMPNPMATKTAKTRTKTATAKTTAVKSALVVLVSALSITATLYQSAERRRRDLAVLRALGAHPREVFALVVLEAFLLTLLGLVLGWMIGHGALAVAGPYLRDTLGVGVSPFVSFFHTMICALSMS